MAANHSAALRLARQAQMPDLPFGPERFFEIYTGFDVVDPITFVVGARWLNRPNLYPRQATLLKVIFLRLDLLTVYDHDVIDEWEEDWANSNGTRGLLPGVREKMALLRDLGHKWFREVLLVMGRRAGKGHVTALAMSYVLWTYMSHGDPQEFYGVDRDKKFVALVFAGKRGQAKANVFGDLANVITGSVCFAPYISDDHTEKLSIYAPSDRRKIEAQRRKGLTTGRDAATFVIQPRESTVMAGRGPTSFMMAFDEMAHVVATGANRAAGDVYDAAKPSLDQFGKDAFIVEPSSPWQMLGKFYELWQQANAVDVNGVALYPTLLSIQLASWEMYYDWERAPSLPLFPEAFEGDLGEYAQEHLGAIPVPGFVPLRGAVQVYDDAMRQEERANPDAFKVERRGQWAAALDAYLDSAKVAQVFEPWMGRSESYGPPLLEPQTHGSMVVSYKAHGDPSLSNANFGFALGHPEVDRNGVTHCVFDLIHHWDPADFPNHTVDYEEIEAWIWENVITKFYPEELTFDQWNSASTIGMLNKKVRGAHLPKRVQVSEKTATYAYNWSRAETAKKAINMGWVHAPPVESGRSYEQAELEMRFLTSPRPGVIEKPSTGPVQTKDILDCIFEVCMVIIGDQANNFLHTDLKDMRPGGTQSGGFRPFENAFGNNDFEVSIAALKGFGAMRGRPGMERNPSRGGRRR